ncbi:hypothetical protein [Methanospirillum hungatei]|uniref:hypothetical protein n=1 Tax=Methanospirillum hungatei TaxID=2203 RepID=UPI00117CE57A|nr:hypothetical protein [Methanospirillum hungatei]
MLRIPTIDNQLFLKGTAQHKALRWRPQGLKGRDLLRTGLFPCYMSAGNPRVFDSVTVAEQSKGSVEAIFRNTRCGR